MHKFMILAKNFWGRGSLPCVLRATGDDVFEFLQGQFTNQLRQAPGSVVYGLWLNQKGKVLADSHVLRVAEKEFVIVSTGTAAAVIKQRLEDYIVADDVTLADETAGMGRLVAGGDENGQSLARVLGGLPVAGGFCRSGELTVFRGRTLRGVSFEVIGPAQAVDELKEKLTTESFSEIGTADL
jgi:tRNA-modifying protein YgfZ